MTTAATKPAPLLLGDLADVLDELVAATPRPTADTLHLAGIGTPAAVAPLLADYARNGGVRTRRSHAHANGFSKLSLARGPETCPWHLRLHVWWQPSRDPSIHDHRWDFVSLVLTGHLRAFNYGVDDGGVPLHVHRFYDADAQGVKQVVAEDMVPIACRASYSLSAGDTHTLDHREAHLVEATGAPAATLVLTWPAARAFSRVYLPSPHEEQQRRIARFVDPAAARDEAARVAAALVSSVPTTP